MAPTGNPRPGRRKARKVKHRPKKNRIQKRASRKDPLAALNQNQERDLSKHHQAEHKPKAVESKAKSHPAGSKLPLQWPSSEPFEKNCLERDPMPADYVFVPRGDVYVTRHCRSNTKELHQLVYKVYDKSGKHALGIRVPASVYSDVQQSAEETAESRADAVKARDSQDLARSRELLRLYFPLMPDDTLEIILKHAFLKGSGRVGRTSTQPDARKALLAVEAHIRHVHTNYDEMLRSGKPRAEARKQVWGTIKTLRNLWAGEGSHSKSKTLPLREREESPIEVIELD